MGTGKAGVAVRDCSGVGVRGSTASQFLDGEPFSLRAATFVLAKAYSLKEEAAGACRAYYLGESPGWSDC